MAIGQLESPLFKAVYAAGATSGTPGEALANGKVYVYEVGGNYLNDQVTVWEDKAKTTSHSQPISLDNAGEVEIWYDGAVDVRVDSFSDELQYTFTGAESSQTVTSTGNYNQVLNGSFETLTAGSPDNWTLAPSTNGTIAIDATFGDQQHGTNSLKFTSVDSGGAGTATSASFDVGTNEYIGLQFSHKVEDADASTNQILINYYQYDGSASTVTPQATVYSASDIASGNSTSWVTYTRRALIPSDAVTAKLVVNGIDGAGTDTTGSLYIDNIVVNNELTLEPLLYDSAGNEVLELGKETTAVTHLKITNAATGNPVTISVEGEVDKGIDFESKDGEEMLKLRAITSAVNEVQVSSAATGNGPTIESVGGDTNVDLNLNSKGTGVVKVNSVHDLETGVMKFSESTLTTSQTITTNTPAIDNSIPTATEGDEILTASITPLYTDSSIKVSFDVSFTIGNAGANAIFFLVDKTGTTTLKVMAREAGSSVSLGGLSGHIFISSPGLSANTYSLRGGISTGSLYINSDGGSQIFGGTMMTQLTLEEIRTICI